MVCVAALWVVASVKNKKPARDFSMGKNPRLSVRAYVFAIESGVAVARRKERARPLHASGIRCHSSVSRILGLAEVLIHQLSLSSRISAACVLMTPCASASCVSASLCVSA